MMVISTVTNIRINVAMEGVELTRLATKRFLLTNWLGILYIWGMLVLSAVSTIQFIYQTYIDPNLNPSKEESLLFNRMRTFEKVVASVFSFDWCLSLFLADNKTKHVLRFDRHNVWSYYTAHINYKTNEHKVHQI